MAIARRQHALQLFQRIGRAFAVLSLVRISVGQRGCARLADPERAVERHEVL